MKSVLPIVAILATCAESASGTWGYHRLIVNGKWAGEPYQYIRHTNGTSAPVQDVYSADMRCSAGAASGNGTQTYTVKAGDELGFGIASAFGQSGPQQVYISKAPGAAAAYDGSGDWTKIYSATTGASYVAGVSNVTAVGNVTAFSNTTTVSNTTGADGLVWATQKISSFLFPLPASTPPGEYLVRAEGLTLNAAHTLADAQFYVACAQVKVTGNGTGILQPSVKFPGAYTKTSAGVFPKVLTKVQNYTAPGPALWPAGTKVTHVVKEMETTPEFRPRSVITRRRQFRSGRSD